MKHIIPFLVLSSFLFSVLKLDDTLLTKLDNIEESLNDSGEESSDEEKDSFEKDLFLASEITELCFQPELVKPNTIHLNPLYKAPIPSSLEAPPEV